MRIPREITLRTRNFVMIRGIEYKDSIVFSSHKGGLFGTFLRFNLRGLTILRYLLFFVIVWYSSVLFQKLFNFSPSFPKEIIGGLGFIVAIPIWILLHLSTIPLQQRFDRFTLSRDPSHIDIFAKDNMALKRLKSLNLTSCRVFELSEFIGPRFTKEPKRLRHYFIRFSSEGNRFNLLNMEFSGLSWTANTLVDILEKGDFSNLTKNVVETQHIPSIDDYLHTVSVPEPRISTKYAALAQGSALFACSIIPYVVYRYLNPQRFAKQLGDANPLAVVILSIPLLELINLVFATYHYTFTETDISKDSIAF